jgi:hypothetical protein
MRSNAVNSGKSDGPLVMALCGRHREINECMDRIHNHLGDAEVRLENQYAWFSLTRVQRRALPAAQALYDLEDELNRLGRESAQLVIGLQAAPACSLQEAIAKLEVVARVIEPDDYPGAHAVLVQAIEELRSLSKE